MTVLASTLIEECAADFDTDYGRWSQDNWLDYINAGERQMVYLKPSSYTLDTPFQLVEGILQSLPTGGIELIDIPRNMGTDGLTPGASIFKTNPKDLDDTIPGWRSTTAAATVVHFMFDPNDRKKFHVYPPQPAVSMGYVQAVYSAVPPVITKSGDSYAVAINLSDEYAEPLKSYMRFRANSVDSQVSQFAYQRAVDAWNLFLTQIGRKDLIESRLPAKRGQHGSVNQPVS